MLSHFPCRDQPIIISSHIYVDQSLERNQACKSIAYRQCLQALVAVTVLWLLCPCNSRPPDSSTHRRKVRYPLRSISLSFHGSQRRDHWYAVRSVKLGLRHLRLQCVLFPAAAVRYRQHLSSECSFAYKYRRTASRSIHAATMIVRYLRPVFLCFAQERQRRPTEASGDALKFAGEAISAFGRRSVYHELYVILSTCHTLSTCPVFCTCTVVRWLSMRNPTLHIQGSEIDHNHAVANR